MADTRDHIATLLGGLDVYRLVSASKGVTGWELERDGRISVFISRDQLPLLVGLLKADKKETEMFERIAESYLRPKADFKKAT